ncbi:hypothetical protein P154DRAFT_525764 [Amniculicola lignicola CBS 123094]|uniref:D-serine dehydratase-like domain-containing protein n=1 Tax=Amniculicola lignicola CBS 123094 TaxID=1392246 RepID=A0A6A5W317_9PLEO|nr:hypothetical protein P154DRAFT_525764 [Amniculicola lignicola CBS 123094]
MPYTPKVGDKISDLDTPSMIVSIPHMESNIKKLFSKLKSSNPSILIRPHLKTTKSAHLAKLLVSNGATGGCCAKLSEAEVLIPLGFTDLLITCEIIGPVKVRRLVELWRQNKGTRIVVDSEEGVRGLEEGMKDEEGELLTLIDLDVGLHRTGVQPGEPSLKLAKLVAESKHLKLIGVQGYEGHLQHLHSFEERKSLCLESMNTLVQTAEEFRKDGHNIEVVTTGGTGTAEFCITVPGVTEVQPGSFLFMDTDYRNAVGSFFENTLTIVSTVISKQAPKIVTIDAGLKSLTTDSGLAECKAPGYTYGVLGDEHGSLSWTDAPDLNVGDRVEMIPSHIDPTINLHDFYYAHRDGVVEEIWAVDARGKVQ